jgi:hypothetical protein
MADSYEVEFERTLRTSDEEGYLGLMGPSAFETPRYLSDGSLIVGGHCNSPDGYTGGTFLFGPDGTYKDTADTCLDTGTAGLGGSCSGGSHDGCVINIHTANAGNGYFIRDGDNTVFGIRRSPTVYKTTQNGLEKISTIFFAARDDTNPYWDPFGWGPHYGDASVVGNNVIFVKRDYHTQVSGTPPRETESHTVQLAAYQLPALTPLWETTAEPAVPGVYFAGGSAGQYYLQIKQERKYENGNLNNHRTLIASTVGPNGLVEKNRVDLGNTYEGTAGINTVIRNDPTDPTVFAVSSYIAGTTGNDVKTKVIRFRTTPTGIVKIDERVYPFAFDFAIAGEYVAIAFGKGSGRETPGLPGGIPPAVFKGTRELTIKQPIEMFAFTGDGHPLQWVDLTEGIDIRHDGKVAVTTGNHVLLYRINDFDAGTPTASLEGMDETFADIPEVECENDFWCDVNERCEDAVCVPITTNTNKNANTNTNAQFSAETATCVIESGRIFCTTPVSYTSEGTGYVQLWREGGTQYSCTPAGTPLTRSLIATRQARTYVLYAATDCEPENADTSTALDTITVQSTAS